MKKKILSLLLSATLIFSMFSLTAFAQETTKTEAWFEEHIQEIHYKVTTEFDNNINEYEYYLKDSNFLIKNVPSTDLHANLNISYNGEICCIYLSKFPFIHVTIPVDSNNFSPLGDLPLSFEDLFDTLYYIDSYTKTVNSKEYYVEAFSIDKNLNEYSEVTEFYFEEDELKFVLDNEYRMEFISTQIDDSVFEPPFFSINLTAIFTIISQIFGFGII